MRRNVLVISVVTVPTLIVAPCLFGEWVMTNITPQNQKELEIPIRLVVRPTPNFEPMPSATNATTNIGTTTNNTLDVSLTVFHSGKLKSFSRAALEIRTDKARLLQVWISPSGRTESATSYHLTIDSELAKHGEIHLCPAGVLEKTEVEIFVLKLKDYQH
jgi:hypothetical protein